MNEYYNQAEFGSRSLEQAQNLMIRKVYLWMTLALAITGMTAFYVAGNYQILSFIFGTKGMFTVLLLAELGLVWGLSLAIGRISALTATLMFLLYSVINGVTLSSIFAVYDITSISTTFFVTAGTFGVMALVGSVTKRDLTRLGSICIMAVFGLIVAAIVNIFLKSSMMEMIVSGVGVLIFVGLTAYDSQKIKMMLRGSEENDVTTRIAVLGALTLYLDFVNIFLYLLRFFGGSRD